MSQTSVLDILRGYTAPRGALVAVLFVLSALLRVPTVLVIVAVHLLERSSERLLMWANRIPPQPARTRTRARAAGRDPR